MLGQTSMKIPQSSVLSETQAFQAAHLGHLLARLREARRVRDLGTAELDELNF
jgi:hypothetical protein